MQPALTTQTDEHLEQLQMSTWMALDDVTTYVGYIQDKVRVPKLDDVKALIAKAKALFKEVEF